MAQKLAVDDTTNAAHSLAPEETLGAMTFTGIRFLLGAMIVLPFAWRRAGRSPHRPLDRRDILSFAGCGVALCLGAVTQQIGIVHTTVSNAGFLTALYVPLVPLLVLVLFRKMPHWATWPAVGCSVLGAFFLNGGALDGFNSGDYWVLFGTLFWAAHVVGVGIAIGRSGRALQLAVIQFFVCGVLSLGVGLATEEFSFAAVSENVFSIAYAGILSVGVAYTLQVVGQAHTHPAAAAIILSSEMLFAALAGAVVLGERLTGVQITGAALILSAIVVVEVAPLLRRRSRVVV